MEDTYSGHRMFEPLGLNNNYDPTTATPPHASQYDVPEAGVSSMTSLPTTTDPLALQYALGHAVQTTSSSGTIPCFNELDPIYSPLTDGADSSFLHYLQNFPPPSSNSAASILDHAAQRRTWDWSTLHLGYPLLNQDYDAAKLQSDAWMFDPLNAYLSPVTPTFPNHHRDLLAHPWPSVGPLQPSIPHQHEELSYSICEGGLARRHMSMNDVHTSSNTLKSMANHQGQQYLSAAAATAAVAAAAAAVTAAASVTTRTSPTCSLDESWMPPTPVDGQFQPTMPATYSAPASLQQHPLLQRSQSLYSESNDDSLEDLSDSDTTTSTVSWMPMADPLSSWREQLVPTSVSNMSLPSRLLSTKPRGTDPDRKRHTHQKHGKRSAIKRKESLPNISVRTALLRYQSSPTTLSSLAEGGMSSVPPDLWLSDREDDDDEYAEDDLDHVDVDDDEYQYKRAVVSSSSSSMRISAKKGRNVDKACNHCKRSHLRCDNMRPCRRCVATGKIDCKDVEHKPRGRPRLHKT